ncbi:MAG TPA: trypsin-like peptidase domain-containing protein [Acidimicrobiales bacterium]|nr:trypsin-like peptidase domain-containing protein [Acidimicrobiales bacterium]
MPAHAAGAGIRWIAVAAIAALIGGLVGAGVTKALDGSNETVAASRRQVSAPAIRTDRPSRTISQPGDIKSILSKIQPAVVAVKTEAFSRRGGGFFPLGAGTGVIINENGEVLTNAHVVNGAARLAVTMFGETTDREADLIGLDPTADLALIKIRDAKALPTAELGRSAGLEVGDAVVAIGNALALPGGPSVTNGIVSAIDRTLEEPETGTRLDGLIQTNAAINPGNSGGPLVDAEGRVVGINTAVIRGNAEGIGFAIAIDRARPVIDDLRKGTNANRPFLGVSFVTVDAATLERNGYKATSGALITEVVPGSAADQAGLSEYDLIVKAGDKAITNANELQEVVRETKPGDRLDLQVVRKSDRRRVTVTIGRH